MSKIKYDPKAQIISIKMSNKKSVDSDVQNNLVIDYDANNDITNIDLMNIDINEFNSKKVYFEEIIGDRIKLYNNSERQVYA